MLFRFLTGKEYYTQHPGIRQYTNGKTEREISEPFKGSREDSAQRLSCPNIPRALHSTLEAAGAD